MSVMTNDAKVRPNDAVICAKVPLTPAGPSERCAMVSGLYTHLNLRCGNMPLRRKWVRRARASGQPSTFQNSATEIFDMSIFRAAPIEEKKALCGAVAQDVQRSIRSALSGRESIASIT